MGEEKTSVSVVVVTYNRTEEVKKAVESLVNQSVKPFEIIIVDSGSDPPLSMKFEDSKIKQIRLNEEKGLSNARNCGIKAASGDYIAFIDDDCIASKHWMEEIQKGIRAEADVLGGPLRPRFRAKPPSWWNEKELGYIVGVGNSEIRDSAYAIWGANMIFRKEVFRKIGTFNPNVGRRKGKLLSGEDTHLIVKAKKSLKILFMPNAVVFHQVRSERLTLSYIIRWAYNSGKSTKIGYGPPSPLAFYRFIKAAIEWYNPFISSGKSGRIQRVARMVEQIGMMI